VGDWSRRRVLAGLGTTAILAGCGDGRRHEITGSEAVGGDILSFNVHPVGGRFEALQQEAVRTLAPPWIRVTLGLVTATGAARPYVRLGPQTLGLVSDFQTRSIEPREWLQALEATLRRYPGISRAELLNEPERFNGIPPARYVQEYLRPGYDLIRRRFPGIRVVAAAPVGDRRQAPDQFRRLTDAGADEVCDYRAVHVYFDDERALRTIAQSTARPILVTETGSSAPGQHVHWYTSVVPRIRGALGAEPVFWYVLLESPDLAGGRVPYSYRGFSVLAAVPDAAGQPQAAPGSGLYPVLARTRALRRR
jgi:hypothetical protein